MTDTYSAAVPLSQRAYYRPNETVDFNISAGAGRAILAGSIRLCGKVIFTANYTVPTPNAIAQATNNIFLDGMVGAHGFFRQMVVSTANQGVLQNMQDYPRAIADMKSATKTRDMALNQDQRALCTGYDAYSVNVIGASYQTQLATDPQNLSFCIDPEICINRSSATNISFAKTGDVKLNLILNSPAGCMYGAGLTTTAGYVLTNLEIQYRTAVDATPQAPVSMLTMATVKAIASSSLSAFSIMSPIPTYSMSMNFIAVANENSRASNSLALELVPSVSRVEFTFQDTNNNIIQYPLENVAEYYKFWKDSYGSSRAVTDVGTVLGVSYNQVLSNSKFNVVIQSALATPTSVYFIFKGTMDI
jgi:hypothetical protein